MWMEIVCFLAFAMLIATLTLIASAKLISYHLNYWRLNMSLRYVHRWLDIQGTVQFHDSTQAQDKLCLMTWLPGHFLAPLHLALHWHWHCHSIGIGIGIGIAIEFDIVIDCLTVSVAVPVDIVQWQCLVAPPTACPQPQRLVTTEIEE